jgi:aarF domain-containing kinase
VIDTNQGLYLKMGQALGMFSSFFRWIDTDKPGLQAALLPKPYREAFGHVFDRAPSVPYSEVVQVSLNQDYCKLVLMRRFSRRTLV